MGKTVVYLDMEEKQYLGIGDGMKPSKKVLGKKKLTGKKRGQQRDQRLQTKGKKGLRKTTLRVRERGRGARVQKKQGKGCVTASGKIS